MHDFQNSVTDHLLQDGEFHANNFLRSLFSLSFTIKYNKNVYVVAKHLKIEMYI